ncbi:helix-turn-helix transcriptional regulator (plasmid) [Paroceanicella profunda]|uniref:Helix-turn-helix transcriptional regulator n=1 Tax=Paroceanicella profunda TaxID=2579971 RepID=A0A5B8G512_9RHOB|nr:helix-turn-helix transcriptional regulator [Paroceanicella profunda]QDL94549.1 helix-turn-helix transcriptional regulator [Paroceanicella profunda]
MDQVYRTPQQIGAALRRRRRLLGLSQAELGARTGLRQATVSSVEAGEAGTRLATLCELMAALDLDFALRPRAEDDGPSLETLF